MTLESKRACCLLVIGHGVPCPTWTLERIDESADKLIIAQSLGESHEPFRLRVLGRMARLRRDGCAVQEAVLGLDERSSLAERVRLARGVLDRLEVPAGDGSALAGHLILAFRHQSSQLSAFQLAETLTPRLGGTDRSLRLAFAPESAAEQPRDRVRTVGTSKQAALSMMPAA